MRKINFSGSLSDFKDSIGMKQPKRGMNADAQRKTAEAMPLVMEELVAAMDNAIPGQKYPPRIQKRIKMAEKFVYENRLYKTNPKKVKIAKPGK